VRLSTRDDLLEMIRRLALRLTAARALRTAARTGAGALLALLLVEILNLVVPLASISVRTAVIASVVAASALALLAMVLQRVDLLTASRIVDVKMGLEERSSTAVEIALASAGPTPMGQRVIADAVDHLAGISGAEAFPMRPPREALVALALVLAIAAWTTWLHGLTLPGTPARRTTEIIKQEGRRLEQFAQALQSRARTDRSVQTRRMAGQMRELGAGLQRERLGRADALARVGDLARQAESIRQQISDRLKASRPSAAPDSALPDSLFRRESVQRQVRQLRELASRLQDPAVSRQDIIDRLGAITREGEGNQPAAVQRQLQQARQQLESGNAPGAGESLTQALHELEGLENLLTDQEGIRRAQQQLEESRSGIAGGGESQEPSAEQRSGTAPAAPAPGSNRPRQDPSSSDQTPPPQGPNEGITPGTGQVSEKLGPATPRLQAQRTPERVKGVQGQGEVSASTVTGTGRRAVPHVARSGEEPALVRQVDAYMERARVPARYRLLVRRYFERLAQLR
jgi:hypothetical protein